MPGKTIFGQIFSLLVIVYIGWMFLAPDSSTRIERACAPIEWTGNLAVSVTALTVPDGQVTVRESFEKLDYGCQYTLWRAFYERDYIDAMKEDGVVSEVPPAESED
ncbi:hypothetical protein [Thioalkalivibrio thiocyanodenitrificans]|uniref:hypothetical protein n=1 Tax=Thioalkalivibrio thiocyanodenitrificans TaxID=243063 RepID=UPI00035DCAE0|nr:hypothetical protein [Thioalkalivibrio thiocyanodenitrificans]